MEKYILQMYYQLEFFILFSRLLRESQKTSDTKTINLTVIKTETLKAYCSDFRYESNGIFVLGVGFFFFRQISTFWLANLDGIF